MSLPHAAAVVEIIMDITEADALNIRILEELLLSLIRLMDDIGLMKVMA